MPRTETTAFAAVREGQTKRPRVALKTSHDDNSLHQTWLTSHNDCALPDNISSQIIVDGMFDAGVALWTDSADADSTHDNGKLRLTRAAGASSTPYTTYTFNSVSGESYSLGCDCTEGSDSAAMYLRAGTTPNGPTLVNQNRSTTGALSGTFSGTGGVIYITLLYATGTDDEYCRFDNVSLLGPSPDIDPVIRGCISDLSIVTQKIDPRNARSSIGKMSFKAIDKNGALTTWINEKLRGGDGLRHRQVAAYIGDQTLLFSDFALTQTQILDDVDDFKDGERSFQCSDIQREKKKSVFDLVSTNLTATLNPPPVNLLNGAINDSVTSLTLDSTAAFPASGKVIINQEVISYTAKTATTFTGCTRGANSSSAQAHSDNTVVKGLQDVGVISTVGFETLVHGAAFEDAPGQTVLYFKIDDEIIRAYGTSGGDTFTDCVRGVLNTRYALHEVDASADDDRKPEVDEYVYWQGPAIKFAKALQLSSGVPAAWGLGISATWLATSAFDGIGADIYDPSDDTAGRQCRIEGVKKQDGKKFIEDQLYQIAGTYETIRADGQISLKRANSILHDAPYVRVLDKTNIVSVSALKNDKGQVVNQIQLNWNWYEKEERLTRTHTLTDAVSIAMHKSAPPLVRDQRSLHGSIHSDKVINSFFDSVRDRYAGPPQLLTVECLPSQADLQVGDIVRVQLDKVRDYVNNELLTLDRSFEIQQARYNYITGKVTFDLFGSSQKASPIAYAQTTALNDSYYTSEGTDLTTVLTGTTTGGVFHVTASGTLTGHADANNAAAIYYVDGPWQIDDGVTVTYTNNVQIRYKGHFEKRGILTGKGQGHAGGTAGVAGGSGIGNNQAASGINIYQEIVNEASDGEALLQCQLMNNVAPAVTTGIAQHANGLSNILIENIGGTALAGIPTDLRGSGGPGGGSITGVYTATGGAGGAGGAGLVLIGRGMTEGVNGLIDSSGNDGSAGGSTSFTTRYNSNFAVTHTLHAGAGAGGLPGGVLVILDGAAALYPSLNLVADVGYPGAAPGNRLARTAENLCRSEYRNQLVLRPHSDAWGARSMAQSVYDIRYVPDNLTPVEDVPLDAVAPLSLTVTPGVATLNSINLAALEINAAAPTTALNYRGAKIYVRANGTENWVDQGEVVSTDERVIHVPAILGDSYDVKAHGVSMAGLISSEYIQTTYTLTSGSMATTLAASSKILVGGATDYLVGSGIAFKDDAGVAKWHAGDPTGMHIAWTGINLEIADGDDPATDGGFKLDASYMRAWNTSGVSTYQLDFSSGGFRAGTLADEKYLQFNPTTGELLIGRGVKAYNNDSYANDGYTLISHAADITWDQSTSGSGSITQNSRGLQLSSTTAASDLAIAYIQRYYAPGLLFSFDALRSFKFYAKVDASMANRDFWVLTGDYAAYSTNNRRIGFRFKSDGKIYGVTSDGTATTETDLSITFSIIGLGHELEAVLDPSVPNVKFYQAGVLKGTSTTNVPTGQTDSDYIVSCVLRGDGTTGAAVNAQIDYVRFTQTPTSYTL